MNSNGMEVSNVEWDIIEGLGDTDDIIETMAAEDATIINSIVEMFYSGESICIDTQYINMYNNKLRRFTNIEIDMEDYIEDVVIEIVDSMSLTHEEMKYKTQIVNLMNELKLSHHYHLVEMLESL